MYYWKLPDDTVEIASIRYRCVMPAMMIRDNRGIDSKFIVPGHDGVDLSAAKVLMIVKSLTHEDVALARKACKQGVRVYLDLCDNIFLDDYSGNNRDVKCRDVFRDMGGLLDGIVVPGSGMKKVVEDHLKVDVPVHIIGDYYESEDFSSICQRYFARNILRRDLKTRIRACYKRMRRKRMASIAYVRNRLLFSDIYAPKAAEHTILWFGNSRSGIGKSGVRSLLLVKDDLNRLAAERNFKLQVISNDPETLYEIRKQFVFPIEYKDWSLASFLGHLKSADVTIIPIERDSFSSVKSINRPLLSLAHSTPVVLTSISAYEPLMGFTRQDDWYENLSHYLDGAGEQDVETFKREFLSKYDISDISLLYEKLMHM